jgi:transposase
MVKKGLRVFEENLAYSTKFSVCCPGPENQCIKNGYSIEAYKEGKFLETPAKMPREVHGLLICQGCKRTWGRDVVGARNILDI